MMLLDASFSKERGKNNTGLLSLIVVLVLVKAFRSISSFSAFSLLLEYQVPVSLFSFLVLGLSTVFFVLIHKPWQKSLQMHHWVFAALYGLILFVNFALWVNALKYLNPLRMVISSDYAEFVSIAFLSLLSSKKGSKVFSNNLFGVIFFVISLVLLILGTSDTESSDWYGSLFLVLCMFTSVIRSRIAKHFQPKFMSSNSSASSEKGGKLLFTVGMISATFISFPFAFYQYLNWNPVILNSEATYSIWSLLFSSVPIALFLIVIDYYVETFSRLNFSVSGRHGGLAMIHIIIAKVVSVLSIVLYASVYLDNSNGSSYKIGTLSILSENMSLYNGWIILSLLLSLLSFYFVIGGTEKSYSLPLSYSSLPITSTSELPTNLSEFLRFSIQQIWSSSSDSRKIFIFLVVNLLFMFVEFVYGYFTNSLGLISDSFHMLFDCVALAIGLLASIMKTWEKNSEFTYGFGRIQVLSGFANGLFLLLIAVSVFIESLKRLWEPPNVITEKLLLVSVAGFCVNCVGLFAFHDHSGHGHSHGGGHNHSHAPNKKASPKSPSHSRSQESHSHHSHGESDHGHGHSHGHNHSADCNHGHDHNVIDEKEEEFDHDHDDNLYGVFLHVLADTLGSVGVIISSLLIWMYDLKRADPLASLVIAVLIGLSVIPLLKSTAATLLQRTPRAFERYQQRCLNEVCGIT
eukprot:TRINITY_DN4205_c0_g1_i3.p1 TRINITY_DN4205_c0_g1~~TRINITY_DN4205_c0_g1_i3.p1  ORF type:complete len:689 (-),score=23.13 TRINITY_DN4205_c0_g1_i3:281-2347(-)